MTRKFFVAMLSLLAAPSLYAVSTELKVLGNQVVTVAGNCPTFLKGVNVPSLEWTNWGDGPSGNILTTVQTMVTGWSCNMIRIPLNQDRWFGLGGCGATASSYQGVVDNIVNYCNSVGVWVMLDLHWSDTGTWGGGSVCTSGQHDMPDNNSSLFWTDVATRYANNPAVWFDLYNEPKGITSWSLWKNGGTGMTDGSYSSPGMQALVNTVRATGAKNIIVAGGLDWSFNLTGVPANALSDATGNGVVYATHIYPWKWPSPCNQSCWDTAVPASVHDNYAVMVTEFGQNNNADGVANNTWSQNVMNWAIANTTGYIAWCMHTGATPNLVSDWSYTPTSWFGTTVKAQLALTSGGGCVGSPTFTNTRTPTATYTRSATPSFSASPTRTATGSFSPTPNGSPTHSPTQNPSTTPSPVLTPTTSDTPAGTLTSSPSPSATLAGTLTSTPTWAPSASDSDPVIEYQVVWPSAAPVAVAFKLKGQADDVVLRIYAKSLVLVAEINSGPANPGWNQVSLPQVLASMANGAYFYTLQIRKNGADVGPRVMSRMLWLR